LSSKPKYATVIKNSFCLVNDSGISLAIVVAVYNIAFWSISLIASNPSATLARELAVTIYEISNL